MTITNQRISRFAETIFSNSDNDVRRPLPMAGRARALEQFMTAFLNDTGPQVVTLSAPLGTGKTFFLNNAFGRVMNETGFPEAANKVVTFGSRGSESQAPNAAELFAERFRGAALSHRLVLVVEELDRKGQFRDLIGTVAESLKWLSYTSKGLLVLTGDRFLEHPEVRILLDASTVPVEQIELEPLNHDLMTEALTLRLGMLSQDGETDSDATSAARAILRESVVEAAVLPPTSPATANFREAFGLLLEMSPYVDRTIEGVSFPTSLLRDRATRLRLRARQRSVDEAILSRIDAAVRNNRLVEPFSEVELQQEAEDASELREFRRNVLFSLVTGQVLVPQGIPYLSDGCTCEDEPYVGPYLPKQNTFLRALDTHVRAEA